MLSNKPMFCYICGTCMCLFCHFNIYIYNEQIPFKDTYHVLVCDWRLNSKNIFPSAFWVKFTSDD